MLVVNLLWESSRGLPSQMRRGRETFGWSVLRKRHNDKTRFLPPSLPLHQLSRHGTVCVACCWRAESNSSASLQMVSSLGTAADLRSVPASSWGEERGSRSLGKARKCFWLEMWPAAAIPLCLSSTQLERAKPMPPFPKTVGAAGL